MPGGKNSSDDLGADRVDKLEAEARLHLELARAKEKLAQAFEDVAEADMRLGLDEEAHYLLNEAAREYDAAARAARLVLEQRRVKQDLRDRNVQELARVIAQAPAQELEMLREAIVALTDSVKSLS